MHDSRPTLFVSANKNFCWADLSAEKLADNSGVLNWISFSFRFGGYRYDLISIRRPFDGLSKVIKVTVT